jgi:DNA-binding transcriptional ArsR family regulator
VSWTRANAMRGQRPAASGQLSQSPLTAASRAPARARRLSDNVRVADLLQRIRSEIQDRLEASRAAIEETARLEAALHALEGLPSPQTGSWSPAPADEERAPAATSRGRASRGANRAAVLDAVRERPGASPAEIATGSGVSQNVVSAQLRALVSEGLVSKRTLPSGRNGYALHTEDAPATAGQPSEPRPTDTSATAPEHPTAGGEPDAPAGAAPTDGADTADEPRHFDDAEDSAGRVREVERPGQ